MRKSSLTCAMLLLCSIYKSFITIIMFVSGHERGYVVEWSVCGKVCVGLCLFLLYYFQQYPAWLSVAHTFPYLFG